MQLTGFTSAGKKAMAKVLKHMQAAEAALATLNADENKLCFDAHNEGTSINHCVRWGAQAAQEIVDSLERP